MRKRRLFIVDCDGDRRMNSLGFDDLDEAATRAKGLAAHSVCLPIRVLSCKEKRNKPGKFKRKGKELASFA
ncbi:hypothetical protein ACQUFY_05835 [Robbsia andropogonis]|uniref:hypothetical protein n=1 Tax=Robbsia andropogonis TaxID=28092 RepID=UPI003D1F5416